MSDNLYDAKSLAEIVATITSDIIIHGQSNNWHCMDDNLREVIREKLKTFNLWYHTFSDDTDVWHHVSTPQNIYDE